MNKHKRLELRGILIDILGSDNVYFQPPSTVKMKYPCIVYNRSNIDVRYANNMVYNHQYNYTITVIDPDPDSSIPDKIFRLPMSRFDRHYTVDNLNHDVFNVYY